MLALLVTLAHAAAAQQLPTHYTEYRADAIIGGSRTTAQAGVGAVVPLGVYVRFALDGAAGATWHDGVTNGSGRVDAIARFLLDPLREEPVAVSLGGGLSLPYVVHDAHVRPFLTAVIDIEGRMRGPITPAVQIGLGGGARIGVVLRTSPPRWR